MGPALKQAAPQIRREFERGRREIGGWNAGITDDRSGSHGTASPHLGGSGPAASTLAASSDGLLGKRTWTGGRKKSVRPNDPGGSVELDVTADSVPLMEIAVRQQGCSGPAKCLLLANGSAHGGCCISETITLAVDECLKANLTRMSRRYDDSRADRSRARWMTRRSRTGRRCDHRRRRHLRGVPGSVNNLANFGTRSKRAVWANCGHRWIVYGAQGARPTGCSSSGHRHRGDCPTCRPAHHRVRPPAARRQGR